MQFIKESKSMRKSRFILWLIIALLLSISPVYAVGTRKTESFTAVDQTVVLPVNDCSTATFQITGTWAGTITFAATTTGGTWVSVPGKNANTGAEATTTTANGLFLVPCGGFNQVRASITTYTSGTASIAAQCGNGISFTNISLGSTTVSTGFEKTDDAAFTPATDKVGVIGGEADDTAPDSVNEGDAGAVRISLRRELYTQLRDAAGNERGLNVGASGDASVTVVSAIPAGTNAIGKLAANSGVDIGDVDVTSIIPGTGATNLGKAEDAAHTSADTGVLVLGVRNNTAASLAGTDGDYVPITTDTNGAVWVSLATKLDSTNDSVTIAAPSASIASGAIASGALASGSIASGALASGSVASGAIASGALASGSIASGALASGSIAAGAIAAGATSIADDEDAASASGDRGVKILARQTTTPADTAGTDLDYAPLQMKNGRVWSSSIATGTNAHDAAGLEANPVTIGFEAVNQDGTPAPNGVSAEGDTVRGIADSYGRQYVSNQHPNSWCASEEETVAVTADEIKAAPGAGLSLYVCSFIVSNGATAGTYSLDEDSGGTPVILVPNIYTAVNGGAVIKLDPCYRVAANQEIGVTSTTVTTGSYTVCGYTAP